MKAAYKALIASAGVGAMIAMAPLMVTAQSGPTVRPAVSVGPSPRIPDTMTVLPAPIPLTSQGRELLVRSLRNQIVRSAGQSQPRADFGQPGMSQDNDAFERAIQVDGRWVARPNVALAEVGSPSSVTIDPAVSASARIAAHQRAGREPTAAEVSTEVAAFDANVARINRDLSARKTEIAAAYKRTGQYPRDLEASIFGVPPRAAEALNPGGEVRAQLQRLYTVIYNQLAREAPLPVVRRTPAVSSGSLRAGPAIPQ